MKPLNETERRIVAELLERAADTFVNHDCNDFDPDLRSVMAKMEWNQVVADYHRWNRTAPEDQDDNLPDWAVMRFLAGRLKGWE